MEIRNEQLEHELASLLKILSGTKFKILKSLSFSDGGYEIIAGENGKQIVKMSNGTSIDTSKLPTKAMATYTNADPEEFKIKWIGIDAYLPNKVGQQSIVADCGLFCIYNKDNLSLEICFEVDNKLSLNQWAPNGATLNGVQYASATKAEDLAVLDDYEIIDVTAAFKGMSSLANAPVLNLSSGVKSLANTFDGCSTLVSFPAWDTGSITNFSAACNGCSSMTSAQAMDVSKANSLNAAFSGCTSLATLPEGLASAKPSNVSNAFYNCKALPEEFPIVIDLSNITSKENLLNMFSGSTVKTLTVKVAGSEVPDYVTPENLGVTNLIILGTTGETIKTYPEINKSAEPDTPVEPDIPTEPTFIQQKYLTSGLYELTIPAGITKVRVAMVAGASYSCTEAKGNADIEVTCNRSAIWDKADPYTDLATSQYLGWGSSSVRDNAHYQPLSTTAACDCYGGIQASIQGAKWNTTRNVSMSETKQFYSVGGCARATFSNGKVGRGYASLANTYTSQVIDVIPGHTYCIRVGAGGISGYCVNNYSENGKYAHYNGFVIVDSINL